MGWVVLGVWCGAVLVAALVLGYCAYQLHWRRGRLARDLAALEARREPLARLQAELNSAVRRGTAVVADARRRPPTGTG